MANPTTPDVERFYCQKMNLHYQRFWMLFEVFYRLFDFALRICTCTYPWISMSSDTKRQETDADILKTKCGCLCWNRVARVRMAVSLRMFFLVCSYRRHATLYCLLAVNTFTSQLLVVLRDIRMFWNEENQLKWIIYWFWFYLPI